MQPCVQDGMSLCGHGAWFARAVDPAIPDWDLALAPPPPLLDLWSDFCDISLQIRASDPCSIEEDSASTKPLRVAWRQSGKTLEGQNSPLLFTITRDDIAGNNVSPEKDGA